MTNVPNKALTIAINQGGYDYLNPNTRINCPICEDSYNCHYELDPLFWQAIGKAMDLENTAKEMSLGNKVYLVIGWKDFARHYFELVLTGGDTELFWQELLNV